MKTKIFGTFLFSLMAIFFVGQLSAISIQTVDSIEQVREELRAKS